MRKRSVSRIMLHIKLGVLANDYYEMGLVCGKLGIVDHALKKLNSTRSIVNRSVFLKGVEDSADMPLEALAHEFHLLYDAGGKQFLRSVDAISGTKIMVAVHNLIVDEAETIRNASPSGKSGPWVTWFTEMWKKSAIKRDCSDASVLSTRASRPWTRTRL